MRYRIMGLIIVVLTSIFFANYLGANQLGNDNPGQLLQVFVRNTADASLLNSSGSDAVVRLDNSYLVLTNDRALEKLVQTGLDYRLIAPSISKSELAVDISFETDSRADYPLIFEENNIRIYRVAEDFFKRNSEPTGLAPVRSIRVSFRTPIRLDVSKSRGADLDSLIDLVVQDSLESYVLALQDFPPRVTGTSSDYSSRDWVYNKFTEFGYDSVVFDTFYYSGNPVQNIVAYKIGTTLPDHQIVIGGHKDAVSTSPGADDNGSGSAGVLELARILKDVETNMTMIFICFDGEEQGLHGSWHYADAAAAAGDSIVMMLNMDMIGYEGNTDQVKLYHSSDQTYAELYHYLADSLTAIGLDAVLSGTISASDHYPFQQNGYDVVFPIEYVFSSVYHTYQDSTSYMDFSYMARIVKASLATAYQVDGSYIPVPGLVFDYPDGLPEIAAPGEVTTFNVTIAGSSGGSLVPGTAQIYCSFNGVDYTASYLTDLGGGLFEAELPEAACEDGVISYYFSAEEATTGVLYDRGPANPYTTIVATAVSVAFEDDFETDKGWMVSGGLWGRGTPTGLGGSYGNPDPSSAYSGSNIYGYNLNGDYQSNIPEYHLTSPAIDCSGMYGVRLSFQRWLGVEQPSYDHAWIRISNNGSTWTTIWTNAEEVTDGSWLYQEFDISEYADDQATVYIRFTMGETDGSWQYCGWNIDDVEVSAYECTLQIPRIVTETVPDWTVGQAYSQQLEVTSGYGTIVWSDKNNDLSGTGLSLGTDGLLSGTPTGTGPITFTAAIVDDSLQTDEQVLSFTINPVVEITTTTLSDWTTGFAYSLQLESVGGTGTKSWSDKNNSLIGTGLALAGDGLLSGTPLYDGTISFTATVSDETGSIDNQSLNLLVNPEVVITTKTLPNAAVGDYYEYQLECTGGTSPLTWSDYANDLDGTGLTLSGTGLLSGTPFAEDTIEFTARVEDVPGSFDADLLSLIAEVPYVCGDANADQLVNIIDVTYIIAFLYQDGPAPVPTEAADVNGDLNLNILDITYLIAYIYDYGPALICP